MYLLVIRIIVAHPTQASHQIAAHIGNETSPYSPRDSVALPRLSAEGEKERRKRERVERGRRKKRGEKRRNRERGEKEEKHVKERKKPQRMPLKILFKTMVRLENIG
jgi:hypothetical protein